MKIVLDIRGWRKIEEVSYAVFRMGAVEIFFRDPVPLLVTKYCRQHARIDPYKITTVMFYRTGEETAEGLSIFEADKKPASC